MINLSICLSDRILFKNSKIKEAICGLVYLAFAFFASIPFLTNLAITIGSATSLDSLVNKLCVLEVRSLYAVCPETFSKISVATAPHSDYGTMVAAGVILMTGTTEKIIVQDKLSISNISQNNKTESVISWRNTDFVIEFGWDDRIEVERPLKPEELSALLKQKYNYLNRQYDQIHLEKVFSITKKPEYEFYCYKNGQLKKITYLD